MTRLDAITQEHRGPPAAPARSGAAVAVLLSLLAIAALAEVIAGAAVLPATTPPVASWERAMQIGDEARQRGDAPAARRAYLTALFRARGERSLPGVLDAAERFVALGDRDVVEQALGMAATFGGADRDDESRRRLRALRERLGASGPRPLTVSAPR